MAIGLGRSRRLGIPRVNANPRPPNERRAAVARRTIAAKPVRSAIAPARAVSAPKPSTTPTSTQPSATPTPANTPVTATPTPPSGPQPLFAPPSYTPASGEVDPRDAGYWANLNKLIFNSTQEYNKNLEEQTNADTTYSLAEQDALRNRVIQQRSLGESAIRSNLSASGWLGRNEAEQTTEYTSQRSSALLSKSQEDQARLRIRAALKDGFSIDAAILLADAAGRRDEKLAKEAENSGGEPDPEATYAGPSPDSYTGTGSAKAFSKKRKPQGQTAKAFGR